MDYEQKYEQKYREALGWMRSLYDGLHGATKEEAEHYFPELKESEDERIRREIIDFLRLPHPQFVGKRDHEKWIAWLEKQGEKMTKPKFKVGDWITDEHLICKVLSVTGKSYELHLYNDDYCHFETDVQSVDKHYHLWTIKDAKEGNILVPKSPKEGGNNE